MLFVTLLNPKGEGDEAIKHLEQLRLQKLLAQKGVYWNYA